ncbi:hypothetical protein BSKO_13482 [Bryopsis sp. KO-2023]|nr:hypothetical protein BSKO_13482 [Bryopsis sp. KO-2023]
MIRSTPHRGAYSKRVECVSKRRDVFVRCESTGEGSASILSEALKGGDVDEAYVKGGEYLRSLGMTNQAEIARVLDIAMNPNSLFVSFRDSKRANNANARRLSVESDMKPLVAFLKGYDMSNEEVARVITMHPPILCYSIEERIEPLVTYLKGVGLKEPIKSLVQRPSLFGLEVDASLEKIVGYLKEKDYSEEAIANILENSI